MKLTNTLRDAFVRQAMDDVPSIDYDEQIRSAAMKLAVAALPPKVRAVWNDPELRSYVVTTWGSVAGVSVTLPCASRGDIEAFSPALAELHGKSTSQKSIRSALKSKLRSVAYGVSTRKALADALPEFAKYLPEDDAAACRSLPVIANVVSDFVAAGWPKGKKAPKSGKVAA